jgi:hyperosmotically inducible periplasmic protein
VLFYGHIQIKFAKEDTVKKILLIPAICALCVSCNSQSNKPNENSNSCSNGNNQSQPADWDITAHVKEKLMTDNSLSLKARVISVTTNNGVVTLTGTVESKEESRKVVRIVKDVPGVNSVDNQLTISNS